MMITPDVLVVTERADGGARAACRLVSAGGAGHTLAVLTPDELMAARWSHRVDLLGRSRTMITAGDVSLDSDRLRLVWFRGSGGRLRHVDAADADYAQAESVALLVSWLAGLGNRVLNRPDGVSPLGPSWSSAHWLQAARDAGLPVVARTMSTSARLVPGWRGSPWQARMPCSGSDSRLDSGREATADRQVLLVDGLAVGPAVGLRLETDAGRRLAAASGCRLLGLQVDPVGRVSAVTPCPALSGPSEIAAVGDLLRSACSGSESDVTGSDALNPDGSRAGLPTTRVAVAA